MLVHAQPIALLAMANTSSTFLAGRPAALRWGAGIKPLGLIPGEMRTLQEHPIELPQLKQR